MKIGVVGLGLVALSAAWPVSASGQEPAGAIRVEQDGLKVELAPLGADPVRAFLLARGFPADDTEHVVESACLFRSAIGSAHTGKGAPEVAVTLTQWHVTPAVGEPAAPMVREDWEPVWKARSVPEDAATAFYWALFPTEQVFYPNDYNWGFLTFGLPAGTMFELQLSWSSGGSVHNTTIKGLQCAR